MSSNGSEEELQRDSWKIDLELALMADPDFQELRLLCKNRPVPGHLRKDVWRICLKPELNQLLMSTFEEIYDLPSQQEIHSDALATAQDILMTLNQQQLLDVENEQRALPSVTQLSGDFEAVLTHFLKTYSYLDYQAENGWMNILKMLYLTIECSTRNTLYAYFISVYHRFVAAGVGQQDNRACTVLRLLLQYHEPALCSFLDCRKVCIESFANKWLNSLFASQLKTDTLASLWDVCFLMSDPCFSLMVSLIVLVNSKSLLMCDEAPQSTKEELVQMIANLPCPMGEEDVLPLTELIEVFLQQTPTSFKTQYLPLLFANADPEPGQCLLSGSLCISVTVDEVLQYSRSVMAARRAPQDSNSETMSTQADEEEEGLKFFLVDCRPPTQYNAGHLSTAFFLDGHQMLSDPQAFHSAVETLLTNQKKALENKTQQQRIMVGEHIVLMSSGREDEDSVCNMVIALFLRLNVPFVSVLEGGYRALHEAVNPLDYAAKDMESHSPSQCLVCRGCATTVRPPASSKLTAIQVSNAAAERLAQSTNVVARKAVETLKNGSQQDGNLLKRFSGLFKYSSTGTTPESVASPLGQQTEKPIQPVQITAQLRAPSVTVASTTAYRNTNAVFTIDDDDEEEEVENKRDQAEEKKTEIETRDLQTSRKARQAEVEQASPSHRASNQCRDDPIRPGGLDTAEVGDLVDTRQWSCRSEVRGAFTCSFLNPRSMQIEAHGFVVLAQRTLLIMREERSHEFSRIAAMGKALTGLILMQGGNKSSASSQQHQNGGAVQAAPYRVERVVPIVHLLRITSNRRIPELITFHYGSPDLVEQLGQQQGQRDRVYIQQAGEAVKMIKTAIFQANSSM